MYLQILLFMINCIQKYKSEVINMEKQQPNREDSFRLVLEELLELDKEEIPMARGFLIGLKAQRHLEWKTDKGENLDQNII